MTRKWLRLEAQWDDTEWVMMLGPLAQLAWVKLLCYAKRDGRAGEVYALATKVAAKKWDIPVRAVDEMLRAAVKDGALVVGEKWVVTKWADYQETDRTAAERMRRMRAKNGVRLA